MSDAGTGYFIGLMSGTSLDGVDGVLAQFSSTGLPRQLARASLELPKTLRLQLLDLNTPGTHELHRAAMAANALSDCYAELVSNLLTQTQLDTKHIAAIGAHGQTIRHQPELGYTLQLLAPARLAERTGISVIADFRSRDIAAGGQGAPLVPAFHQAVFGQEQARVILNLGGIANVTILDAAAPAVGFDTGPANLLLDLWCERHTGHAYDKDGQWAASGEFNQPLLDHLIASEPWFALAPPKSTGRDLFNAAWLDERLKRFAHLNHADVQATLAALTAQTIVQALSAALGERALMNTPIYVCGGGARNASLMAFLQNQWPSEVNTTDALGIDTQDMEALAFAWLAWAHLNKNAGNLPQVTGASGTRILGAMWPA
jgi:anhydro-N-acetylmuramic acid kinase